MKNTKGKILALVTAQNSCGRIIKFADEYATRLGCELVVLTALPLKSDAENRSRDMITLTNLSKETGKDIKIIYSDRPLLAVLKESKKINPLHIFVGQGGERSEFLTALRIYVADSPISVVGTDGIIFSLPSCENMALNLTNITT